MWPDNWPAFKLFYDFSTQFHVGLNGYTGLRYATFFHELDRRALPRDEYDDIVGCLQVIEGAALKELNKR